ncbi:hypothetical protein SAMN06295912_10622 [Sphingomonas laterariae]|uniref:MetA-pathway of phenol degradation n=1 Tax=Edaphosphingomonas laterariae TaxID=861865 RepID=A0A239EAU4_9SPHN|nr:hypothetical protein [Sphingomonas laterariae]SNS41133.1 hypothetical protein SAMN06295912_10622 [Sphingomonas laterariae]
MKGMLPRAVACCVTVWPVAASAQQTTAMPQLAMADLKALQDEIDLQRSAIAEQRRRLDAQEKRLIELEEALLGQMRAAGVQSGGPAHAIAPARTAQTPPAQTRTAQSQAQPPAPAAAASKPAEPVQKVGEQPAAAPRQEMAVLADRGSVLTKAGRLTVEPTVEYGRADRNRFVFRGIEVPQSVLVGVFDINESRQDVLTLAGVARFGISDHIEIGVRIPWVYRQDSAVLVPLVQNPPQSGAGTVNTSAKGSGIGDVEFLARYLVSNGTNGWPFLTANLQVVAPTGKGPFDLPRSALGNATKAATGGGFWSVAPSVTAIVPSDPATLFAVLGYNFNFGEDVDTRISDAQIDHVEPGSGPNMTAGLGLGLNERTSISFAYAHNWVFSTKSLVRPITIRNGQTILGDPITTRTRDLQIGRFLFGISYRVNTATTINWTVEMGATDDATDLRTTLRVPLVLN